MKINVRDWLIDNIIECVIYTGVYDKCTISTQSIKTKKFTDIFYLLSAEQTASVVDELCERGFCISLGKLSSETIEECLTHIVFYSQDLSVNAIPHYYVSSNITDSGVDTLSSPRSKPVNAEKVSGVQPPVDDCSMGDFEENIKRLQNKYPDSIVVGVYKPYLECEKSLKEENPDFDFDNFRSEIESLRQKHFSVEDAEEFIHDWIKECEELYLDEVEEDIISVHDEDKNPSEQDLYGVEDDEGNYSVGIYENLNVYIDLPSESTEQCCGSNVHSWSIYQTDKRSIEFKGRAYIIESDGEQGKLIIASTVKDECNKEQILACINSRL
jgi:hypothetical protein